MKQKNQNERMIYLIFACKVFSPSALFTCSVTKYMLSCRTRFHLSAFWSLHKQRECKKTKHSSVFLCLICRLLLQTFLNCSHLLFFLYSRVLPHLHRGGFYSPFCHTLSSFLPVHCSELRGLYCSRDTLLYQLWVLFALISLLHLSKSCLLYKSVCSTRVQFAFLA